MGTFLLLLLGSGVAIGAWVAYVREQERIQQAWSTLAREAGLQFLAERRLVSGPMQPRVLVETRKKRVGQTNATFTVIEVSAPLAAENLMLSRENPLSRLGKLVGVDDVRTGDEVFDATVHVRGGVAIARAVLSAEVRGPLEALVREYALVLREGKLSVWLPGTCSSAPVMLHLVEAMRGVALGMAVDPAALDLELARRIETEINPSVRLALFEGAQGRSFDSPTTRGAAETLLLAQEPALRLAGAVHLKDAAAREVLRALVLGKDALEHRVAALHALIDDPHPYEEVQATLDDVLRRGRPELRVIALQGLVRAADATRIDAVRRCLARGDEALTVAALEAIRELGDASDTDALVALLSEESTQVQLAAVRALAEVGTVAAVEALLPHASSVLPFGALKTAALDAIRSIQSRAGPVEGGRLSLVGEESGGELSLAVEGGGLAIAEESDAPSRTRARGRESG